MKRGLPSGFSYRKDGTLHLAFTIEGKRYYVYGKTQKECKEKEQEKRKAIAEKYVPNSAITLSGYYREWQQRRKGEIKESTLYVQNRRFAIVEQAIGKKKLQKIEIRDIQMLRTSMIEKGYTTQGINDVIDLLRSVLNSAKNDRIIPFNPCDGIRRLKRKEPKAVETIHKALSQEEQKAFFKYSEGTYYHNLFRFMVSTGVRTGEAAALLWSDIDTNNGVIHITKTATRVSDNEIKVLETKTKSSKRDIPLTKAVQEILREQMQYLEIINDKMMIGNSLVFPSLKRGSYVSAANISPVIKAIIRKAKKDGTEIHNFSAHAFRDTYATRCIEQGMNPHTLMKILGHSNLNLTMNLYAQALPETIKEAAEKIVLVV